MYSKSRTSKEGYKLHTLIYHSNVTNMWEIAGMVLLSSETKEKVQTGLTFFRDSLLKNNLNVDSLIFFTDKDFDYISVSEAISRILNLISIF